MSAEFWYRMVLLTLSSFLCGMTLVIFVRYYFAWRERKHNWRGLLPLHVFTVTLSYNLLLVYATIETYAKIQTDDDVVWWRGALLIPAYFTGFAAMYAVARLRSKKQLVEDV